jgi:MFS family permease
MGKNLKYGQSQEIFSLRAGPQLIYIYILIKYDFSVYGYFSDIIGKVFFPPTNNPNGNLLKSFAVFGIAFLVRPIGGAIFGHMGDNGAFLPCLMAFLVNRFYLQALKISYIISWPQKCS